MEENNEHNFILQNIEEAIVTMDESSIVSVNNHFFRQFTKRLLALQLRLGAAPKTHLAQKKLINMKLFRLFEADVEKQEKCYKDKESKQSQRTKLNEKSSNMTSFQTSNKTSLNIDFSIKQLLCLDSKDIASNVY